MSLTSNHRENPLRNLLGCPVFTKSVVAFPDPHLLPRLVRSCRISIVPEHLICIANPGSNPQ